MSEELFEKAAEAVCDGNVDKAVELAETAVEENIDPLKMIEKGFTVGITEVGDLFDQGEVFLPQLMSCSEAMKAASDILKEAAVEQGKDQEENITVVIGSVAGDVHDIGKGIVKTLLEANGMDVYDLGTEVSVDDFISKAKEVDADVISTSSLLTTTMAENEKLINTLKEENLREQFDVLVGGAPVTEEWAEEIEADGYGETANQAVKVVYDLVG
ncbi:cobalamin B12-binding domain-containing protein [Acetohalobium arabaticum]|uniref:Methyltransferase cognate corrinoid protein n=1 Tax=Acetohalobium arabaticum (strain ATCC 49924 / DSM 5501 / Z-7288) TaxID=574087 RepID=D9QRT2_ACEAZ|nr:corrinoid protein [Acetohalobium arabaticum]ADL13223.1 methyltransferase cognate corrinoid protein [Acetohalobium arabaticum DSM 5501]